MRTTQRSNIMKAIITYLSFAAMVVAAKAAPLRTGFDYQGRLSDGAEPAGGVFEFRFELFDASVAGASTAGPITNANVNVTDGLFTTVIDFGPTVFDGAQYWLEIGVRPNRSGAAFTTLTPRQVILPTPYALRALSAAGAAAKSIDNEALAASAVSADKIAARSVVKSLNGLTDGVELVAEGDLTIRQERNQLVLAALPSCLTYSNCYWNLLGNGNITAGVNFLGTIAGELDPLEFRVNNNHSLRHVFTSPTTAPNLIGGYRFNSVSGTGGTISGGGRQTGVHQVSADWGTIGGGFTNSIRSGGTGGTIGGGATNEVFGPYGTIAGGGMNVVSNYSFVGGGVRNRSLSDGGVIGGGYSNLITTYNFANVTYPSVLSVIGGGASNTITGGVVGTIGGGQENLLFGSNGRLVHYGTIGGGQDNAIVSETGESRYSSIGGGFSNRVTTAGRATIGGGDGNRILLEGIAATISGGQGHLLDGPYGTISGGRSNVLAGPGAGSPDYGTIGGGDRNSVLSDSHYSTIAGGRLNRIQGFASDSTIGGGTTNAITAADFATIGGGGTNSIADNANFATIGGGRRNRVAQQAPASAIGGGDNNTISASATNATISGGRANLVDTSAPYAAIPGGQQARATNYNQYVFASGQFSQVGDAQHSQYVLRNTSTGVVPAELFLDGAVREIVLWPSSVLTFDILVVGVSGNDSAGYQIRGVIERNGAGINLVGVPSITTLGEDVAAWGVVAQADPVNTSLSIIVTGAGNAVVRWVAHVRTVEVRL